jgi:hypothetical protein
MADVQTREIERAHLILRTEIMYGNRSYKDMQHLLRKFLAECKITWHPWKTLF